MEHNGRRGLVFLRQVPRFAPLGMGSMKVIRYFTLMTAYVLPIVTACGGRVATHGLLRPQMQSAVWLQARNDANNLARSPFNAGLIRGRKVWEATTGIYIMSMVANDDTIFLANHKPVEVGGRPAPVPQLSAVRRSDGREIWSLPVPEWGAGYPVSLKMSASGLLLVAAGDKARCTVCAYNVQERKRVWTKHLLSDGYRFTMNASPVGAVLVGIEREGAQCIALEEQGGTMLWSATDSDCFRLFSADATGHVYYVDKRRRVVARDALNGKMLWSVVCNASQKSAVCVDGTTLYVVDTSGTLRIIDGKSRKIVSSTLIKKDGILLGFGKSGLIYMTNKVLDAIGAYTTSGRCIWTAPNSLTAFLLGDDDFMLVGERAEPYGHRLALINGKTGKAAWRINITGEPAYLAMLDNNRLYLATNEGLIMAFE